MNSARWLAISAVFGLMAAGGWWYFASSETRSTGNPIAVVSVPDLSGRAEQGHAIFDANCAACHGQNAAGRDGIGPPLVHRIYEPSHHGDAAFQIAVLNGVRQHHWQFGNMAPVQGVSESDVSAIIEYVRALQRANGID